MEESYRGSYQNFRAKFGHPWYFSHRVDLHNELRRVALDPSGNDQGARLHLSSAVIDVDCEHGILTFEDGTSAAKDLIVGADGVHVRTRFAIRARTQLILTQSIIANRVLGDSKPAVSVNECAFRFLIPTKKLQDNEITSPLFQEEKTTFHIASSSDRRLVWYPCRKYDLYMTLRCSFELTTR